MKKNRLTDINTSVILAGGNSARLGVDKQLLKFGGKLAAVYVAEKLEAVFDEILIVTNKPELYADVPYKIVSDIYKNKGPLAGIHAGLVNAASSNVFVTACDMPYVSLPYVKMMVNKRKETDSSFFIMAVKWDDGYIEPFNGFYSKCIVEDIEHALENGRHKVNEIFNDKTTFYIRESDLKHLYGYRAIFTNLNRPEDIEKFRKIITSVHQVKINRHKQRGKQKI